MHFPNFFKKTGIPLFGLRVKFYIISCPTSDPLSHFNVAELVNEPGNHNFNTKRGGRGGKEFLGFTGHDIMAMSADKRFPAILCL